MIVWRDGDFVEGDAAVSASDRGYLLGDGVFETVLTVDGRPAFLDAHLERLHRGAAALSIPATINAEKIGKAIADLSHRVGVGGLAACRVTLTRRDPARGLAPGAGARAQLLLSMHAATPRPAFRVMVARPRRFAAAPTNAFKCIGAYAPNLLARLEAQAAGADEALMLNEHGRLASASAANVFIIEGDSLATPSESEGAMPGVTRALVLRLAAELGIRARTGAIAAEALAGAPLFLTNSLIGVAPATLDGAPSPAPLVLKIKAAYEAALASALEGGAG